MRNKVKASLMALALLATAAVPPASASEYYYGGWSLTRDKVTGKVQFVTLGNLKRGVGLKLRNSYRFCHRPGSADRVGEVLENENDRIRWEITDDVCDNGQYIRICVHSRFGEVACATFEKLGWQPFKR